MGTPPPPVGASNAGVVGKNCNYWPISGFGIDDWWRVINSFNRGLKCITAAMHQWTLFITEQNLIVRTGKSEAEAANNKR